MSRVVVKLIKGIFLLFIYSNVSFADFAQEKVRYLSYFDIINHFQNIGVDNRLCGKAVRGNMIVNGYSSPITGKPINSRPNFDFINSFLSCLTSHNQFDLSLHISDEVFSEFDRTSNNFNSENKLTINKAVDELILKLIGPEIVLVSYGFTPSLKEFREDIIEAAKVMTMSGEDKTIDKYLKNVFILIHLRDEFLSY